MNSYQSCILQISRDTHAYIYAVYVGRISVDKYQMTCYNWCWGSIFLQLGTRHEDNKMSVQKYC